MDELILNTIGLNKNDVKELYRGLVELVDYRLMRAGNK